MTEEEYKQALAEITLLWDQPGEKALLRFDALLLQTVAYEEEHYPIPPPEEGDDWR